MKLGLILSNDWELYGDGSGDYFEVQHRPLQELLNAADEFDAKVTVLAEVGQQLAHRKLSHEHSWAGEISAAWEDAVRGVIRAGHDVQLHWHPQWLDARYNDNRWDLNYKHWAISSLPPDKMLAAISNGKSYLESLLRPARRDYQCNVFRAGAYCLEPSRVVIDVLRHAGIQCDTSVTQGLFVPGEYDFRDAHSNVIPWTVSAQSVKHRGHNPGLIEMPIASVPCIDWPLARRGLAYYYTRFSNAAERSWARQRDCMIASRYPARSQPRQSATVRKRLSLSYLCKILVRRTHVQLDYDYLPATVFVDLMERILELVHSHNDLPANTVVPLMASGHVKNMPDADNVRRILEQIVRRLGDNVVHWTAAEAVRYWQPLLQTEATVASIHQDSHQNAA